MNSIDGLGINFDGFNALKSMVDSGVNIDPALEILANTNSVEERREIISAIANEALRIQFLTLSNEKIANNLNSIAARISNQHLKNRFTFLNYFFNNFKEQLIKKINGITNENDRVYTLDLLSKCFEEIKKIKAKFHELEAS